MRNICCKLCEFDLFCQLLICCICCFYQSPVDGKPMLLTPEESIQIQVHFLLSWLDIVLRELRTFLSRTDSHLLTSVICTIHFLYSSTSCIQINELIIFAHCTNHAKFRHELLRLQKHFNGFCQNLATVFSREVLL